jgi:predicted nucleic acid-binding protein
MENPRLKIFLDTSALIAGLIEICVSRQVIVEADRNIEAKLPEMLNEYRAFIEFLAPVFVDDPSPKEIKNHSSIINSDDAPILAAAVSSGVNYLVTWDKKHFIKKDIRIDSNLKIVTPGKFLRYFRDYIED